MTDGIDGMGGFYEIYDIITMLEEFRHAIPHIQAYNIWNLIFTTINIAGLRSRAVLQGPSLPVGDWLRFVT